MDIRTTLPLAKPIAEARYPCTNADRDASRSRALAVALAVALGLVGETHAAPSTPLADTSRTPTPAQPRGGVLRPVSNCNDAGAGSLRAVAAQAVDGDGIDLSSLTCSTISVTSGSIALRDVELIGPGAAALTIKGSGNQGRRLFDHSGSGGGLTIRDVTVQGAKYQSNAGQGGACLRSSNGPLRIHDSVFDGCLAFAPTGTNGAVRGGAIAAYGNSVVLSHVILTNNQARSANGAALGGALYAFGDGVLIDASTIANNSATAVNAAAVRRGGGVFARGAAEFWRTTIDGNLSEGGGGGALVEGGSRLVFSTVSNNIAVGGGSGIAILGTRGSNLIADIFDSTISGNEAQASTESKSGALYINSASGTMITNSTIAGNIESNTQGIAFGAGILFGPATGSNLTVISTIVHGNHLRDSTAGADIGGPFGSTIAGDHNLIGVSYLHVPNDTIRFSDPLLGPLQDNGGPTRTRMPAADSPVIDRGNALDQPFDQREFPRVVGVAADIGAVEAPSDVIFADGFDP